MPHNKSIPLVLTAFTVLSLILPFNADAQSNSWRNRMQDSDEGSGVEAEAQEAEISSWRSRSSAAQSLIDSLGSDRVESIAIPVLFGIQRSNVTSDFGDPRGGGTRSHEGQDLISKTGIPIVSPTDAVVSSTGYGESSGFYVYTSNPGGERFVYMHLDRASTLTRGTKINRGDLIGFVGNTGNAAGGVSHLHFEIKKDGAMDPYPRLTGAFTAQEKIAFFEKILSSESDPAALANLVVAYYPQEFRDIKAQGVTLPSLVENALGNAPSGGTVTGSADLTIGSSGSAVASLQSYLIRAAIGPAANALAGAGATGYFGAITQRALAEFQGSVGISATGVYGSATRAYVSSHPVSGSVITDPLNGSPSAPLPCVGYGCPATPTTGGASSVPTGDLGLGAKGSAVVWLQTYLIGQNKGSAAVALAGAGATGNFGPMTQRALAEYQAAVGISPASGYFGPLTRASIRI